MAKATHPLKQKKNWYNQYRKKYTEKVVMKIANDMVEYFQKNLDAIHFTEYCADRTINKKRLSEFRQKYEFFAEAYEICRSIITKRWIAMGKKNDAKNQAFVIFGLKNVDSDDFKDKQDVELSGDVSVSGFNIVLNNTDKTENEQ